MAQYLLAVYHAGRKPSAEEFQRLCIDVPALDALTPTPVVALNRAVALAEVCGPAAGLAAVDELRSPALDSYYLFHAACADLLRRLGRDEEAAAGYDVARSLTANPVEQAFLDAQHAAVLAPGVD